MDLDELKMAWKSQSTRLDKLEQENRELRLKIGGNNITNNRTKLLRTYRVMIIVCVLISPYLIYCLPILNIPLWLSISYGVVMLILAGFNGYIYNLIRKINLSTMTTKEALEHVIMLDKRRQQLRVAGCIIGIVLVVIFFKELWLIDGKPGLIGGIVGGIIGAIIGIRKEREIRAIIRAMQADLEELCSM